MEPAVVRASKLVLQLLRRQELARRRQDTDEPPLRAPLSILEPFLSCGATSGSPQAVRWSDNQGQTWSEASYVTATTHGTQNSQPMVMKNGMIVDTYYDYGAGGHAPDVTPGAVSDNPRLAAAAAAAGASPAVVDATGPIYASGSSDGGKTWQQLGEVTNNGSGYAPGVRCCLFAADIDPANQRLYVAWLGGGPGNTDPVLVSSSKDGRLWSSPVRVSQGDVNGVQRVNVDVVANAGAVYVSYGTRTDAGSHGGFVQQQLSVSSDRGLSFASPMSIGPLSVLQYAAQSRGYFPGDYIGSALTRGRLYVVWSLSTPPPASSTSPYHQVIDGATLRP
ncbi:MAG: hypothetical protein ACR2MN_01940 [Acidimicrobiales bacterium]